MFPSIHFILCKLISIVVKILYNSKLRMKDIVEKKSHIWVKRLLISTGILQVLVIGVFLLLLLLFDLGFFLSCLLLSFHSSLLLTVRQRQERNRRFRAAHK